MLPMGRKYRNSNKENINLHPTSEFLKTICKNFLYKYCRLSLRDKEEVIETLKSYVQHEGNEMCGVLTGTQVGKNCYRICKISPPCVKAHTRCGCERDATIANKFIEADYERSEHTRFILVNGIHIQRTNQSHLLLIIILLRTIIIQHCLLYHYY